jgi:hypothetical protein
MTDVEFERIVKSIQDHFTDGLVLVVGSGLSAAEGMPGMPALAAHLRGAASALTGTDAALWANIDKTLAAGEGLEAALLKTTPSESLELWIQGQTCSLLLPAELKIIGEAIRGNRTLPLTSFLNRLLRQLNGLPILTPNYDRLIEVACELAGYHVDTTTIGQYAGSFDHGRSCMASCKGIVVRGKATVLDHYPRAVVLKPHGSLDWYRQGTSAVRCSLDLPEERVIITPGQNKYRAGYNTPFDKHRELANNHINQAARLFVIGYGFNDDHLQVHLASRITTGTPTLILNRTATPRIRELIARSPACMCLSRPAAGNGVAITDRSGTVEHTGADLWNLDVLTRELLR